MEVEWSCCVARTDPFLEFSRAESYWAYHSRWDCDCRPANFKDHPRWFFGRCQVQSHWRQGCHPSCKKHQGGITAVCGSNLLLREILNVVNPMAQTFSWGWFNPTIAHLCLRDCVLIIWFTNVDDIRPSLSVVNRKNCPYGLTCDLKWKQRDHDKDQCARYHLKNCVGGLRAFSFSAVATGARHPVAWLAGTRGWQSSSEKPLSGWLMSGGMYCRAFPSFLKFFLVLTFFHPDLSVCNCASFTVSAGGQTPGVLGIFFFQNWVAIPEKIIPCQQIIKILESLSLPKYYLVVCTIMVACRKNGGYQTSGFWFWFWQCGYICQKTRLPSGGFEMTMMARCFMFLLRPVEISSNPVTNHGAPGFTKLDGFWHVFDAFFCHAQAIPAIGWLDDWDWVQRTLRSLGSPGQCDLRQRRRLSVPSLRAKVAETWLGHGSRLRGARSITELRSLLETFTWIVVGGLSLFFPLEFFWVDPLLLYNP